MSFLHWIALLILAAGTSFFVAQDIRLFRGPMRRARAVVIDQKEEKDTEGGRNFFAKFRFTPEGGQPIEVYDGVGSARPDPATGKTCEVVYPADRPERARIRRPILRAFVYLMMGGCSVLIVLSGMGVIE